MYVCMYVCMYVYIYIYRDKDRDRERERLYIVVCAWVAFNRGFRASARGGRVTRLNLPGGASGIGGSRVST